MTRFFSKNNDKDTGATVVNGPPEPSVATDETVELNLGVVLDSPFQPRQNLIKKADVLDLMTAIEAAGQLAPIVVSRAEKEGCYHVHSGHRRCAALRFLGRTKVSAIVKPELSELEARKIALVDNLGREDLTAYEQAIALRGYVEATGSTHEQASQELGINRRLTYRLKNLLSASKELQALFRQSAIAAKPADLLVRIESRDPRKARRMLERYAAGKISSADLERENKSKKALRAPAAKPPIEFCADSQTVTMKLRLVKAALGDEERRQLRHTLQKFLREVGISEVRAA